MTRNEETQLTGVGITGGAALDIFDPLHSDPPFTFILAHHEQGAGHMAEGYARASGKPGVVMVTSGPGTSNLATPLLNALLDGVPLIAICGQVPTVVQGTDAFQEIDSLGLGKTCTKWCGMPRGPEELPEYLARAFEEATGGRPGPVLLAIPKDVSGAHFRPEQVQNGDRTVDKCSSSVLEQPEEGTLDEVANLINKASKPVIVAGHGLLGSHPGPELLNQLIDSIAMPVTTTFLGLGAFDELQPLALGMLGTYGTVPADLAVQNADLVRVIGARLDERAVGNADGFAPAARDAATKGTGGIVHFDICPEQIGKVVRPTVSVVGDLRTTLPSLLEKVTPVDAEVRNKWLATVQDWKQRFPLEYQPLTPGEKQGLLPQEVIMQLEACTRHRKEEILLTTGVGQHQMWTARYFRSRVPKAVIGSGGLGTMGFGLPAAVGVKLARPDCTVVDVDGDASFCMTPQGILTAVQHGVDVKVLLLRNEEQGMVQELQRGIFEGRITQVDQRNPDFVRLAESMGAQARRCARHEELRDAVDWLLEEKGVALLEVVVEGRLPMVPKVAGGKALDGILDGLEKKGDGS
ncbi:thiamine pyrophosphate-binding protein [Aspergillus aculeatinus CBS 121060]|uniref:Acetolactate synthase n=1 Tax=Aspergillus aculeatinus CBS 121060 TaxID=1448322 RepID=A0ACD1GUY0_9EURO|nr:acetolactate synthase [Aspergillus aculeatinus CBS 121060]RAH65263.1 acetolactate synthase [Aspergillus aculeatinus CBS 121060]